MYAGWHTIAHPLSRNSLLLYCQPHSILGSNWQCASQTSSVVDCQHFAHFAVWQQPCAPLCWFPWQPHHSARALQCQKIKQDDMGGTIQYIQRPRSLHRKERLFWRIEEFVCACLDLVWGGVGGRGFTLAWRLLVSRHSSARCLKAASLENGCQAHWWSACRLTPAIGLSDFGAVYPTCSRLCKSGGESEEEVQEQVTYRVD